MKHPQRLRRRSGRELAARQLEAIHILGTGTFLPALLRRLANPLPYRHRLKRGGSAEYLIATMTPKTYRLLEIDTEGKTMSDKGKTAAIEQLRKELGFGCPLCRSPFLTWHHFDPPWEEENHWRPEGMIALCLDCHPTADIHGKSAGAYSKTELRALKKRGYSSKDVRGDFLHLGKRNMLVRMGGCYTSPSTPVLSVNGVPQISFSVNEADMLCLSFELRSSTDKVVARMEENLFTAYPASIDDMIVKPQVKDVTVWLEKEDVGLELSFRRIPLDELEVLMANDGARACAAVKEREQKLLEQLPPAEREWWRTMQSDRDEIRKEDLIAARVTQWAKKNCQMDDGLIPILNFEQMAIHFHGHRITIKDGIADSIFYCSKLDCDDGFNLGCPCPQCVGIPTTF